MNANYAAWDIDIDSLKTPESFIKAAVLAPSGHNSQPWSFRAINDTLSVRLDSKRLLSIGDRDNRQACISLGCAVANIEVIAAYHEYATNLTFTNTGADLNFLKSHDLRTLAILAPYLTKRTTNRSAYVREPLPEMLRNGIDLLPGVGTTMHIVEDPARVNALGSIAIDAAVFSMEDASFRKELSRHVLSNLTRDEVGMPGFGLGFPLPISFIAPYLIRFVNVAKLSRVQDMELFKNTPAIGIIETKMDTTEDWINVGRAYERLALLATSLGYCTAMWGAPVQVGDFPARIGELLGLSGRPQAFFRIGRAVKPVAHAPRIPAERVLL